MLNPNFVFLGVFIQMMGALSYLKDTIRGKIQPNKVSQLLWGVAPLIAFSAEISQGVRIQALTTFIVGFIPLSIFIASFTNKKAYWKIERLDLICGMFSLLGIILWIVTRLGDIAILFAIFADGLATVPTMVKSYYHPESENDALYWTGVINAIIGLLVIQTWNFAHVAFPTYLIVSNLVMTLLIRFKIGEKRIKLGTRN
ncbi:MAG: hypothetical protein UX04_C0009G0014 [Microgenomates group bacterium GW2011_GWF2_45_18]|nr:MAG: hypothetical protein UW18_C0010G0014 [Microgenomates group bacterium GW2011_GWF1_44_10]KKU01379.1 MAG: hypothetical protein UX04_C0009G0014 [Microgenomates group bacterium GW2011_GWF2_45_18]OGJ41357.1 MAG: hypothetical protein A2378_03640 [Candidatus Pacebacteria bacterium RIFOXYB1_FULL_44_10]HAU98612.1 hypothetical protein [Candidatus Paceibacterota bacterium]HAX01218.1 hypothetical protein [Candidatus Paceibacterota bacterium]